MKTCVMTSHVHHSERRSVIYDCFVKAGILVDIEVIIINYYESGFRRNVVRNEPDLHNFRLISVCSSH